MTATDLTQYLIRDYKPGDEAAILRLFDLVFGKTITLPQWRWKYQGTGTGIIHARVTVDRDNTIVGHAGAIPLQGYYQGKKIPFFQICDVMIHPQARGHLGQRNLYTKLLRSLVSDIARRYPGAFCYGFPGKRQFRLGEWAQMYGKVESAVEIIREPRRTRFCPLQIKKLPWTNGWLDQRWTKLAPQYGMAVVRDQRYLQWRYAENPFYGYDLLGLNFLGYPLGWVVTRQDGERLLIVDLLIRHRWLSLALQAVDNFATAVEARSVGLWLPADWRDPPVNGVYRTTEVVTTNVIWDLNYDTDEVRKNLYYTMGDVDIF